jgi:type IV secretory pathway TraG/TraD family ATPase VirD4
MPRTVRPAGSTASSEQLLLLFVVGVVMVVAGATWVAVVLANPPGYTGGNPITVMIEVLRGRIQWTAACWEWMAGEAGGIGVLGLVAWRLSAGYRGRRSPIDSAARSMARPRDIKHLTGPAAEKKARRLQPRLAGVKKLSQGDIGPVLCRDVRSGKLIQASMEDNVLVIAGPRRQKTRAVAIPSVAAHPGPTVVTSVRRDIVDDTRGVREKLGRVWVFDPQHVAKGRKQDWWYNPLGDVMTLPIAAQVANIFAAAERDPGAKVDAHFDNAARQLITRLVLAAAVGGGTMVDVYRWTMDPDEALKAVRLLETAARTSTEADLYKLAAAELAAARNEPDKMRGSTFGSARTMLSCLADPDATSWVTPQPGLPCFNPTTFAESADTLYALTEGGPGSPAPLVGLLTASVIRAAKDLAADSPGARLPRPLLAVLDEAANIVRIPELPQWFSHFGGRGIVLEAILQSYPQGRGVWGENGMDAMWGASNHILYLGGNKDPRWLDQISQLVGEHEITTLSHSSSRQGASRSVQTRRERILTIDTLAALPEGRAVLISSGTPPILGATVPWDEGPYAAEIQASHDLYTPKGEPSRQADLNDAGLTRWEL